MDSETTRQHPPGHGGSGFTGPGSAHSQRQLIHAALVVDGAGRRFAPGALLVEPGRVIAAGAPAHIGRVDGVCTNNLQRFVVLPALVNAHAHLDLTHLGPREHGIRSRDCTPAGLHPRLQSGFVEWVQMIRAERATEPEAIRRSVLQGAALARAGGTALIGDIAGIGSAAAVEALRDSGLAGVSYLEIFGMGRRQARGVETMRAAIEQIEHDARGVRLGVQPHAPYSAGIDVYRAAAATGLPVATHLAETLEELEFTASGGGPIRGMLEAFGVWDDSIAGADAHPVDVLRDVLERTPVAAAHVNYVDDAQLEALAATQTSVVYCPRASAYFGHPRADCPPHRYRDMIEAGINVALGTDSIVCLNTPGRISVLDEMRFLYTRDRTDPELLLRMATVNGANALQRDPDFVTFAEGAFGGAIAVEIDPDSGVDPLVQVVRGDAQPVWVA